MNDWNGHFTKLVVDEDNKRIAVFNNNLYQINVIDFNGNFLLSFIPENPGVEQFMECNFAPDGDLYFVFKEGLNSYIYFYDFNVNEINIFGENLTNPRTPAISNNGKYIAYILNGNLWISDLDEDIASQITDDGMFHKSPVWSPDDKWIATVNSDGINIFNIENNNYMQINALKPDLYPDFKGINGFQDDYKISWRGL